MTPTTALQGPGRSRQVKRGATNLFQLFHQVGGIKFDFIIRIVKTSFDYLVHNIKITYRGGDAVNSNARTRGKV